MSLIRFRRVELPPVIEHSPDYVKAGNWSFDPTQENSPADAWAGSKAWAAYALWLEGKNA